MFYTWGSDVKKNYIYKIRNWNNVSGLGGGRVGC
jgi:hypothetical protein